METKLYVVEHIKCYRTFNLNVLPLHHSRTRTDVGGAHRKQHASKSCTFYRVLPW